MKTLNIPLEDIDYDKLLKIKESKGLSWREFILLLAEEDIERNE